MLSRIACLLTCLALGAPAYGLTAVCKNATGRILGVHGDAFGGKSIDERDGISGATFTVLWNAGDTEAKIVTQSSGGGTPTAEQALLIFQSNEQLSFLVLYESAVWLYSVYPKPKLLIMSSHNNGMAVDAGGALAKTFQARCEIGE